MTDLSRKNPYRPGSGHRPPYLAGRKTEIADFVKILEQELVLKNLVITGLRGIGKTVLLDEFKSVAIGKGWHWVGENLSEAASINEERLVTRLLTDLSVITSNIIFQEQTLSGIGFGVAGKKIANKLNFEVLTKIYQAIPGLPSDKLRKILEIVWDAVKVDDVRGIVFAYDEAQTLTDHAEKDQFPLALLLDVFQSIQKKGIPLLLVLTGLPILPARLSESRTYIERMFNVTFLTKLNNEDSRDAIIIPLKENKSEIHFTDSSLNSIIKHSGGYPYFIQFICREVFDIFLQKGPAVVPIEEILRKLDRDFFSSRWSRLTDRQRDLLYVIAELPHINDEFTVQEIVKNATLQGEGFTSSYANQMLNRLIESGHIYRNRHGKYCFAVPLLRDFIIRQKKEDEQ